MPIFGPPNVGFQPLTGTISGGLNAASNAERTLLAKQGLLGDAAGSFARGIFGDAKAREDKEERKERDVRVLASDLAKKYGTDLATAERFVKGEIDGPTFFKSGEGIRTEARKERMGEARVEREQTRLDEEAKVERELNFRTELQKRLTGQKLDLLEDVAGKLFPDDETARQEFIQSRQEKFADALLLGGKKVGLTEQDLIGLLDKVPASEIPKVLSSLSNPEGLAKVRTRKDIATEQEDERIKQAGKRIEISERSFEATQEFRERTQKRLDEQFALEKEKFQALKEAKTEEARSKAIDDLRAYVGQLRADRRQFQSQLDTIQRDEATSPVDFSGQRQAVKLFLGEKVAVLDRKIEEIDAKIQPSVETASAVSPDSVREAVRLILQDRPDVPAEEIARRIAGPAGISEEEALRIVNEVKGAGTGAGR